MVVEDEPDLLAAVKMALERKGYHIHGFSDSSSALQHFKEQGCKDCNLVLSDIKMQPMTGVELAIYLKKIRADLRIVIMSAMPINKNEWRKVLPKSENIDDFLAKPFTTEELLQIVKKWEKKT